jgi:hypothetical protein
MSVIDELEMIDGYYDDEYFLFLHAWHCWICR